MSVAELGPIFGPCRRRKGVEILTLLGGPPSIPGHSIPPRAAARVSPKVINKQTQEGCKGK